MSTLSTLFGGLLMVVLLYVAGAQIRNLPLALRAALASGLPLVAYFVYLGGRWPGLDVAAMHIAVFLVAGLLLYTFARYRQRSPGRLHWIPRVLIGFFVMLAIINAALLYVSTRGLPPQLAAWWLPHGEGVKSGFSGVVTHGEEAARAVSSELNRAHSAKQLGWRIRIDGLPRTAKARQQVRVQVVDAADMPVGGVGAELRLARPGVSEIHSRLQLVPLADGMYGNLLELPAPGRWIVEFRLTQAQRVVYAESREVYLP